MNDIARGLTIEAEAAQALLANIRDVIGDDEQAAIDAIEGETDLIEVISSAVDRITEIACMVDALKAREKKLKERRERLERQAEHLRTAVSTAMAQAEIKRLELPPATLTLKSVPPKAIPINEAEIPSEFWKRQDPKLDMRALLAALKQGPVPGAVLSNGGTTIQITVE